jgi:hypothetical protein
MAKIVKKVNFLVHIFFAFGSVKHRGRFLKKLPLAPPEKHLING